MARIAVAASALWGCSLATDYKLHTSFMDDFFSPQKWTFMDDADPTAGAVTYMNRSAATAMNMIGIRDNGTTAYIGPDLTGIEEGMPIPSVRLESIEKFNEGLFIFSMDHQPTGCGVWPAFWMTGDDPEHPWPSWGEADWLEGAHGQSQVWTTLHTWANCDQSDLEAGKDFSGHWMPGQYVANATNCSVHDGKQFENEGCPIVGPADSMGTGFNKAGGGTYGFEWDPRAGHVRAFYFRKGNEPDDLISGNPKPDTWGLPFAKFLINTPKCPKERMKNMKIVLNTDFCGAWGDYDNTFHESCPHLSNYTCADYVSKFPGNLTEAYWSITRLDVYQNAAPPAKKMNDLGLILTLTGVGAVMILAVVVVVARQLRTQRREPLLAEEPTA